MASPPLSSSRAALRASLLQWRSSLPAAEHAARSQALSVRLAAEVHASIDALRARAGATCVIGVYWPIRHEPDVSDCIARWRGQGHRLALPRVVAGMSPLEFGIWSPDAAIAFDRFGIGTPALFERAVPDVLVVPCVGFDALGYRLGYGGGYYDATLAALAVPAIGVAFEATRIECFEPQAHDRKLSAIVTESARWPARQRRGRSSDGSQAVRSSS